jgi:hypothetical protein
MQATWLDSRSSSSTSEAAFKWENYGIEWWLVHCHVWLPEDIRYNLRHNDQNMRAID